MDGGASIWLPMLIGAGTSVATSAIGSNAAKDAAKTQATAATQAADTQGQTTSQILDFLRQQSATNQQYTSPYVNLGNQAGSTLASLMGLSPSTTTANPATPSPMQPNGLSTEPTVMMRAPDGSTRSVPQSKVARYQAKGATVIPAYGNNPVGPRRPEMV